MKTNVGASVYETVALPLSYVGTGQNQAGEGENSTFTPHLHHTREATSVAAGGLLPDQIPPSSAKRSRGSADVNPDLDLPHSAAHAEKLRRRLEKRSIPEPNTGCTLYFGAVCGRSADVRVYGQIRVGKHVRQAYRVAYSLEFGRIPDGLHLDHKCRQPACINPRHLEAVTPAENTRRAYAGKSLQFRSTCNNGHDLAVVGRYVWKNRVWCRLCKRTQQNECVARAAVRAARRDDSKPQTDPSVESRPGAGVGSLPDASGPIGFSVPSLTEAR